MDITSIMPILQMILAFGNICVLGYALFKFLNKPRIDLEAKITVLEHIVNEIKKSLLQGNDRFREQENTNEVLINSVLSLIEFEIQYCLTEQKELSEGLRQAKTSLHNYLAKKR